jgi:D-beta-D-heptose 7-phosphate kinase/D-beta-D-heptose 1-phosphate adenosyltransferase
MKKIVLVTGGFDPIHSGHIAYFNAAKLLGDELVVGLNSDAWLERKKGRAFMPFKERLAIVENLKMVDAVLKNGYRDADGSSRHAIQLVKELYPNCEIIFANAFRPAGDGSSRQSISSTDSMTKKRPCFPFTYVKKKLIYSIILFSFKLMGTFLFNSKIIVLVQFKTWTSPLLLQIAERIMGG